MKFNRKYYENLGIGEFIDDEIINSPGFLYRCKWISELIKPGSILDLGCSNGIVSMKYAYDGRKVLGIDLSHMAIKCCNNFLKKYHLTNSKYKQGMIEEFKSKEKFDNIFICEVIEHVENPELLLDIAENHLAKDGIIFITTPEYNGPFGKDNPGDTDGEHLRVYKDKEFKKIIEKRGKIIDFQSRQLIYCAYQLKNN